MLSEHVKSRIIQLRSRVRLFSHDARTGADLEIVTKTIARSVQNQSKRPTLKSHAEQCSSVAPPDQRYHV